MGIGQIIVVVAGAVATATMAQNQVGHLGIVIIGKDPIRSIHLIVSRVMTEVVADRVVEIMTVTAIVGAGIGIEMTKSRQTGLLAVAVGEIRLVGVQEDIGKTAVIRILLLVVVDMGGLSEDGLGQRNPRVLRKGAIDFQNKVSKLELLLFCLHFSPATFLVSNKEYKHACLFNAFIATT